MRKIKVVYNLDSNKNVVTFNTQSQISNWHSIMEENYPATFKVLAVYELRTLKDRIKWRLRVLKNDIRLKLGEEVHSMKYKINIGELRRDISWLNAYDTDEYSSCYCVKEENWKDFLETMCEQFKTILVDNVFTIED